MNNIDTISREINIIPRGISQTPTTSQSLPDKDSKPDLSTMGHKESPLVEPLLSTEGESTANRKAREALNSLIFILMNGSLNIPLPENENFSNLLLVYSYFTLWQKGGVLKSVLTLLEEEAQEPLKSHYRSLVQNFQKTSNCKPNRVSLHSLKLNFDEPVESFQGVTDEQWLLIEPLLVKNETVTRRSETVTRRSETVTRRQKEETKHWSISDRKWNLSDREWNFVEPLLDTKFGNVTKHRPVLNLIFSLLITRASSFGSSNLTKRNHADKYLALWKKNGTLKKVLIRLIEATHKRRVQSDYRKMLNHLQNLTVRPIPQLQPQPIFNKVPIRC